MFLGVLPLIVFTTAVCWLRPYFPPWIFMWILASTIYFCLKWLTVWDVKKQIRKISLAKVISYLFLWPGMDSEGFLTKSPDSSPKGIKWLGALGKTVLGGFLFFGLARFIPKDFPILIGWMGMIGLILMVHFGTFHLLALFWQSRGIEAEPLMETPVFSQSVSDFWGKRWNRGFSELSRKYIFSPLKPILGVGTASFLVFLTSGLIHDLVISFPARGGYGLPTAYFMIQWLGLAVERSSLGVRWKLRGGLSGWIFMAVITAAPAYLLFHPVFIKVVFIPMMENVGAL